MLRRNKSYSQRKITMVSNKHQEKMSDSLTSIHMLSRLAKHARGFMWIKVSTLVEFVRILPAKLLIPWFIMDWLINNLGISLALSKKLIVPSASLILAHRLRLSHTITVHGRLSERLKERLSLSRFRTRPIKKR